MKNSMYFYRWMAGIVTGLTVTAVSGYALWQKPMFAEAMFWQALLLSCLIFVSDPDAERGSPRLKAMALWAFLALIFIISWRVPLDIYFIYTIVWVAVSAYYMAVKWCWVWLLLINVAWLFVRAYLWHEEQFLIETVLVGTFHLFALMSSLSAKEASEANDKTQQLNRELFATQHLLSEASRESERTRIARDLHDLVGHHLTALTINLQVAGHLTDGEAKDKVDQCYALSKLLLADVRDAVSALRSLPVVDLKELLRIAIRDIPRLSIELDFEQDVRLDDVNTGEALLRMVQEAITNTLKHTQAKTASIAVRKHHESVVLTYTDHGASNAPIVLGNGLKGMQERFEKLGGYVQISTTPSFTLTAKAPLTA